MNDLLWLLLCCLAILLRTADSAPVNLQSFDGYGDKIKSPGDNAIHPDAIYPDDYGLFADDYSLFPEELTEALFMEDFGLRIPVDKKEIPDFRAPEYYSYFFRTPVGDVTAGDVIAAVTFQHTPDAYFYQISEAGPTHVKAMYHKSYRSSPNAY